MKCIIFGIICSLSVWGCKGDPGPAGPGLSGNILGSVTMVDSLNRSIQDKSGVRIILYPNVDSTTSRSDGSWELNNVPAGIYDITYVKSGFYTQKIFQFQFVGGGNYSFYPVEMIQFEYGFVSQFNLTNYSTFIHFQGTVNAQNSNGRSVYIFLSKSPFGNLVPVRGEYVVYANITSGQNFSDDLTIDNLSAIAVAGDTLYAVAVLGGGGNPGINFTPTEMEEFDTEGIPLSNMLSFIIR